MRVNVMGAKAELSGKILAFGLGALVALVGVMPDRAGADQEARKIELFPLSGEGLPSALSTLPRDVATGITTELEESWQVVVRAESSVADTAMVLGCDPSRLGCLEQLTGLLSTDELLWGQVEAGEGEAIKLTLKRFVMGAGLKHTTVSTDGTQTSEDVASTLVDAVRGFLGLAVVAPPADLLVDDGPDESVEPTVVVAEGSVTPELDPAPMAATESSGFDLGRVKSWTWGVAGAGAFSLVAGGVLLSSASGIRADVKAADPQTVQDFETLTLDERRGLGLTRGGSGLLLAGGGILMASTLFAVLQSTRTPLPSEAPLLSGLAVAPLIGPDGAGLVLTLPLP